MNDQWNDERNVARGITPEDLVAYAEGRMPPGLDRRAAIERQLRENPEAAARVRAYIGQNQAIRAALGDVTAEEIPPRLQPARVRGLARPADPVWRPLALAASLAVATLAGFLLGRADPAGPETPNELADRAAVQPGDTARHVADGFEGIRYAGPQGEPVHLFRSLDPGTTGPDSIRSLEGEGFNLVYWQQEDSIYALAGPVDVDHLRSLAYGTMARFADEPLLSDGMPQPAVESGNRPIPLEPLRRHDLHIAPVPEMMPAPAPDTDGV